MSRQNKDLQARSGQALASVQRIVQAFDHAEFTDGGGAAGTVQFTESIPKGATFLKSNILSVQEGFAGDVSAVLVIGDGTDVDRYNTGTPNVFADAEDGVDAGAPSGVAFHTAAVQPTVTVTVDADWGSVTAGKVVLELLYVNPAF